MIEITSSMLKEDDFKDTVSTLIAASEVDHEEKFRQHALEYINDTSDSNDDMYFYDMLEFTRFLVPGKGDNDSHIAYTDPNGLIYLNCPSGEVPKDYRIWEFIYDHECLHQLWETFDVAEQIKKDGFEYNHQLLNIASDCVINDYLKRIRHKKPFEDGIFPEVLKEKFDIDYDPKRDTQYSLYIKLLEKKDEVEKDKDIMNKANDSNGDSSQQQNSNSDGNNDGNGEEQSSGENNKNEQGKGEGNNGNDKQDKKDGQNGNEGKDGKENNDSQKDDQSNGDGKSGKENNDNKNDKQSEGEGNNGNDKQDKKDGQNNGDGKDAKSGEDSKDEQNGKEGNNEKGNEKNAKQEEQNNTKGKQGNKENGSNDTWGRGSEASNEKQVDANLDEIRKKIKDIKDKYRNKLTSDIGKFIEKCKSSANGEKNGLVTNTSSKGISKWDADMQKIVNQYVKKKIFQKHKQYEPTYKRPRRGYAVKSGDPLKPDRRIKEDKFIINFAFYLDKSGSMTGMIGNVFKAAYKMCESIKSKYGKDKVVKGTEFKMYAFDDDIYEIKYGKQCEASCGNMDFAELSENVVKLTNDYLVNVIITDAQFDVNEAKASKFINELKGILVFIINNKEVAFKNLAKKYNTKMFYIEADPNFEISL